MTKYVNFLSFITSRTNTCGSFSGFDVLIINKRNAALEISLCAM